jgi:hypothetical protein
MSNSRRKRFPAVQDRGKAIPQIENSAQPPRQTFKNHHSLQNRAFAETLDLLKVSSEFEEASRLTFQGGIPPNGTDSAFRNRST